jgi:hypothetical protein
MGSGIARSWGTTAAERSLAFPGDRGDDASRDLLWRGVDVGAPASLVFRWLCQLRVAPYSYDWIDNLGRRSPPVLVPGLEELCAGQTFMKIFRLQAFEPGVAVTLETPPGSSGARLFGVVSVTYWARSAGPDRTRLLAKLRIAYPRGISGALLRALLPWGDLLMMRRQLLNLKQLAEEGARGLQDDRSRALRAPG